MPAKNLQTLARKKMRSPKAVMPQEMSRIVLRDTLEHWKLFGLTALQRVYENNPEAYLTFISRLLPRTQPEDAMGGTLIVQWGGHALPAIDAEVVRESEDALLVEQDREDQ